MASDLRPLPAVDDAFTYSYQKPKHLPMGDVWRERLERYFPDIAGSGTVFLTFSDGDIYGESNKVLITYNDGTGPTSGWFIVDKANDRAEFQPIIHMDSATQKRYALVGKPYKLINKVNKEQ